MLAAGLVFALALVITGISQSFHNEVWRTINAIDADEWIVSQRLAELLVETNMAGFELRPVRHKARYQEDAMPATLDIIRPGEIDQWDQALYAFLAEKERRSGSRRTVESYSRMPE